MRLITKHKWVLLLLFLLTLPTVRALAVPGFYTSHDGETHTARLANYYLALREGQLPPQLAPTLFGGFGFPIFVFIYPLPYLLGSIYHLLGFSYTDSTELVMATGQILSALVIFLFFRLETKNSLTSFVASLFFTWAPYRFLMLYVRGAFAESFAYLFIATSLLCLNRLVHSKSSRWIGLTGLSLAALLLSHQLVSAMFLPVLTWYLISKLIRAHNRRRILTKVFLSLLLGFTIAAFIYLPSFFERRFLRFDNLIDYYQDHFVTISQLIRSPWSYGFSHQGLLHDDMSFQIGLTHLVVVFLSLLAVIISLSTQRTKFFRSSLNTKLLLWLLAFFLSAAIMIQHPLVELAWKHIPGLSVVDFPWRFLGVSVFTASMLTAYLLKKTKNNLIIIGFLLFFVFYANRNHLRINQTVEFSDPYFDNYPDTATWRNEFLPRGRFSNKWSGIHGHFDIERGQAAIQLETSKTHLLEFSAAAAEPTEIVLHRLYFPGWQVFVDDQPLSFDSDQLSVTDASVDVKTDVDRSAFIKIALESGDHHVSARFLPTPLRRLGFIISILGFIITLALIAFPRRFNHILQASKLL